MVPRFFNALITFCASLAFAVLGASFIAVAAGILVGDVVAAEVDWLQATAHHRISVGVIGLLCVVGSLWMAQSLWGRSRSERSIVFDNPSGQVTVSLEAVEEFVRRSIKTMANLKDLNVRVGVTRRQVDVRLRGTLHAGSSIPQTTESVQRELRERLQQMLGIEEPVRVAVHIRRIDPVDLSSSDEKLESEHRMAFPDLQNTSVSGRS